MSTTQDPLEEWQNFVTEVRIRLEKGRETYGDKSFDDDPVTLLKELQQEAMDLAGWGYVLWVRCQKAKLAAEKLFTQKEEK